MPDTFIRRRVTVNLILYTCEQNLSQEINNASKMPAGLDRLKKRGVENLAYNYYLIINVLCVIKIHPLLEKTFKKCFVFILKLNFFSVQWPVSNNIEILYSLATTKISHRVLTLANQYLKVKKNMPLELLVHLLGPINQFPIFLSFIGESSPSYGILKSIMGKKTHTH